MLESRDQARVVHAAAAAGRQGRERLTARSRDAGGERLRIAFTDRSAGDVSTLAWNFGDEVTSIEQAPEYRYASAGDYPVRLTDYLTRGGSSPAPWRKACRFSMPGALSAEASQSEISPRPRRPRLPASSAPVHSPAKT